MATTDNDPARTRDVKGTKSRGANRGAPNKSNGFDGGSNFIAIALSHGEGRPSRRLPSNWRDRLPAPASYYAKHVPALTEPDAVGWARRTCPLHVDHNAALSVHVHSARGAWRCSECGKGGDLLAYHCLANGMDFRSGVRSLLGLEP